MHEWTITLRDDKQGFIKTCVVEAERIEGAVLCAFDGVVEQGYEREQFVVVEAKRGHEVRRVEADVIEFVADGKTHKAVVGLPTKPTANAMIREYDGKTYAISIALGGVPAFPDISFIARPVDPELVF